MSVSRASALRRRDMNSPLSQKNPRTENSIERPSEYPPLTLHVPEPAVRPGGTPDFSNVRIPQAGSVARPAIDADPETIRDLAYSIIRVLDRYGEAVGPWAGLLSDAELLDGLRHIRAATDVMGSGTRTNFCRARRHSEFDSGQPYCC